LSATTIDEMELHMTGSVLVPLDGSPLSEGALAIASEIASGLSTPITLLTSGWGSTVEELQSYLDGKAALLDVPVTTSVVPDTFPSTAIANAVAHSDDAVVMATHGRSGLGRAFLGSVAEDVLKRTDSPVVLLGPGVTSPRPIVGGVLMLTTDGSAASAAVLPRASEWARKLRMTVHITWATTPSGIPIGASGAPELEQAARQMAEFLRAQDLEVVVTSVVGLDAAQAIADYANEQQVALIAMTTHGRTGLARTALGSTTMKVVHMAGCPVLVQKPVS
jgi:nucleotide-binding universal stress UspA family protein